LENSVAANIKKDANSFADRLAKRVEGAANVRRRGRHRVAFIALRPHIEVSLARGHTMKVIWEGLRDEGRVSMTYETFRTQCHRARVLEGVASPSPPPPPSVVSRAVEPRLAPARAQPAVPRPDTDPATSTEARAFQHERTPQKDEIYG
jgi:Family of unknown function (DUF5338)